MTFIITLTNNNITRISINTHLVSLEAMRLLNA